MVNKRQMRQLISRGRREQIERNKLESISQLLGTNADVFTMSRHLDLAPTEIKRLLRKLQKINEMPRTLPAKLKKEGS